MDWQFKVAMFRFPQECGVLGRLVPVSAYCARMSGEMVVSVVVPIGKCIMWLLRMGGYAASWLGVANCKKAHLACDPLRMYWYKGGVWLVRVRMLYRDGRKL